MDINCPDEDIGIRAMLGLPAVDHQHEPKGGILYDLRNQVRVARCKCGAVGRSTLVKMVFGQRPCEWRWIKE